MRALSTLWGVVSLLLVCQVSQATQPRFRAISPIGGQRGTEIQVDLIGDNLEDAEELLLYDSGMEVTTFEQVTSEDEKKQGKRLKLTLKIADNCPLGAQRMRIRTRTGLSELLNFHVGTLPIVKEVEPNTEFDTPQVIQLNHAIEGKIDREDVDYYVVEAKQGDRLTAQIFGQRFGNSSGNQFFDPYLAILNKDRFELAVNDDTTLLSNDSLVSVIVPEDGKYYVQVRDASYNGDGRALYLLQVGTFSQPTAVVPAGGRPGETLTVTFLGDVAGPAERTVTLPETISPDGYSLEFSDEHGTAPTPLPIRISALENIVEQEPNNDLNTATAGPVHAAFNGVISEAGDRDFFKFSGSKGQFIQVEAFARRIRSGLDPVITLYNAKSGKAIKSDDDSRRPDAAFGMDLPEDGEYVLEIRDHLGRGNPTFSYRVEITGRQQELNAEPIEFARYVQHQIIIPQGGGAGIVANIQRNGFGGAVNFRSDDLPPGVRVECPTSWREDGTASVVFYADEDAPLSGKFSRVEAFLDDPKQPDTKIIGKLRQNVLMIRYNNDDRVLQEQMNRMPIIVVEKPKFRCWVEAPKVPLVRGGALNLVVKCEREEGFNEEISLQFLQNPPGINSNGSAKIPGDATEAVIAVNAAGNAAIRESMIAVRCTSKHGNGQYEVVTPFVPLRVEEQYVTFEFTQGAIEQGKEIPYLVNVTKRKDFEGEATVELLGLPANTTAEPVKLTKDTTELQFTIKAAENAAVGMNQNLICRVEVPENGTTINHSLGNGKLRVDKPAPPPKDMPNPPAAPPEQVAATPAAPPKPLSRLEQLRLQQKEKAAGAAQ